MKNNKNRIMKNNVDKKMIFTHKIHEWLDFVLRVAVGVWKPLAIFMYLQDNYREKFMQWRNLYAYISRIYE